MNIRLDYVNVKRPEAFHGYAKDKLYLCVVGEEIFLSIAVPSLDNRFHSVYFNTNDDKKLAIPVQNLDCCYRVETTR